MVDMQSQEQEIAEQLEKMRVNAILDLHEWDSTKGKGLILNQDGTLYSYNWFLGFNKKSNNFGMCTSLEKVCDLVNCEEIKSYLQNDIGIFNIEYDNNFQSDKGCDIVVKFNDKSKYSNNLNLYKRILSKMKEFNIN